MAPQAIKNIIVKFKSALRKAGFPPFRVRVFGSYARGDARPDSDIDLCLISPRFKHDKELYRKKAVFTAFEIDPRIQVVVVSPAEIRTNSLSPLFSSISKESIAA